MNSRRTLVYFFIRNYWSRKVGNPCFLPFRHTFFEKKCVVLHFLENVFSRIRVFALFLHAFQNIQFYPTFTSIWEVSSWEKRVTSNCAPPIGIPQPVWIVIIRARNGSKKGMRFFPLVAKPLCVDLHGSARSNILPVSIHAFHLSFVSGRLPEGRTSAWLLSPPNPKTRVESSQRGNSPAIGCSCCWHSATKKVNPTARNRTGNIMWFLFRSCMNYLNCTLTCWFARC